MLGTRALRELCSRTCYIKCKCTLTWSIPQTKRCSFQIKHAHFMQNKLMLMKLSSKVTPAFQSDKMVAKRSQGKISYKGRGNKEPTEITRPLAPARAEYPTSHEEVKFPGLCYSVINKGGNSYWSNSRKTIKEQQGHCSSHCLNLVIVGSLMMKSNTEMECPLANLKYCNVWFYCCFSLISIIFRMISTH